LIPTAGHITVADRGCNRTLYEVVTADYEKYLVRLGLGSIN
jgi:hypothetical protein